MSNILNKRAIGLLLRIRNGMYLYQISKHYCICSYACEVIKKFKNLELVYAKKRGRRKLLFLTKKGREVQKSLSKIMEILENEV